MSIEELKKHFKKIDNIEEYVKEGIKSGKLPVDEVVKSARIFARRGILGEEVITWDDNGLEETRNIVKLDEKTRKPGWVVTDPNGDEYIIEDSEFKNNYEIDPKNPDQYKPKGDPVLSTPIYEHIEFKAPWGKKMKIEAGDSLILNGPNNIYGIPKSDFENSYASTGKNKTEVLREALNLFGISEEEFLSTK